MQNTKIIALMCFSCLISACGGGGGGNTTPGPTSTGQSLSSSASSVSSALSSSVSSSTTLDSIAQNLDKTLPSLTLSNALRSPVIQQIDDILWAVDETQSTPSDVLNFYKARMAKVATEMQAPVTGGFKVWMMYNHGFIVKTPTSTFAFDLVQGKSGWDVKLPNSILDQLDAVFYSHEHSDHYDDTEAIPAYVKMHGGQVVYPLKGATKGNTTLLMSSYQTVQIKDLKVTAYEGEHNAPVLIYEVITGSGYKIVHTGDNQDSAYLPELDNINVLLLNGWINESGNSSNLDGMKSAIGWMKPDVMIPGHFEELAHHRFDRTGRYRYTDGLKIQDDPTLETKTVVLTWGESLQYTAEVCTSPLVRLYNKCSAALPRSTIPFRIKFYNEIPIPQNQPGGLAEDDVSVWISNDASFGGNDTSIYRYNKSTGQLIGKIPSPSKWPRNLAFDGQDLWLTDYVGGGKVFRLSRTDGAILSSFPLSVLGLGPAYREAGLASDGHSLYYATSMDNLNTGEFGSKIYKLDPITGQSLGVIYSTKDVILGLAFYKNSLWYSTFPHPGAGPYTEDKSRLVNISLSGETLSEKKLSTFATIGLTNGPYYLLYVDGSRLVKINL